MELVTKGVDAGGMVIGCGIVMVSRSLAQANQSIPSAEQIETAKLTFVSLGLKGASVLVEAIQTMETENAVVGYFGFTLDREGLTRKALEEGESDGERMMKVMALPHPQWGHRTGSHTVLGDLVKLAEDLKPGEMPADSCAMLSQAFEEAAVFLSKGSAEGQA